jgi:hypothetical protein
MRNGLVALLKGDAAVHLACAGIVAPTQLPEGTALGLTYQFAGGSSDPTFDTPGVQKQRVQFDAHAPTVLQAVAILTAVRTLLEGHAGPLADGTYIVYSEWLGDMDFFDSDPRQYRVAVEYRFFYTL